MFVSAILAPLTIALSGSASAGYGNLIRLNLRNGDVVPTRSDDHPRLLLEHLSRRQRRAFSTAKYSSNPVETMSLDFNHDPSGDCDDDLGYFAIQVEYNQLKTSFYFFENGPL